jgi:hypothetical protein
LICRSFGAPTQICSSHPCVSSPQRRHALFLFLDEICIGHPGLFHFFIESVSPTVGTSTHALFPSPMKVSFCPVVDFDRNVMSPRKGAVKCDVLCCNITGRDHGRIVDNAISTPITQTPTSIQPASRVVCFLQVGALNDGLPTKDTNALQVWRQTQTQTQTETQTETETETETQTQHSHPSTTNIPAFLVGIVIINCGPWQLSILLQSAIFRASYT